jgi:hypothetical protein
MNNFLIMTKSLNMTTMKQARIVAKVLDNSLNMDNTWTNSLDNRCCLTVAQLRSTFHKMSQEVCMK